MVTSKGFYLDIDGLYKDIEDDEEIATLELEHSVYGSIKYVVYGGVNRAVRWMPVDENTDLSDDWEGEIS